jgi:hypothetical protein
MFCCVVIAVLGALDANAWKKSTPEFRSRKGGSHISNGTGRCCGMMDTGF